MNTPLVSIIMPAYNAAPYIKAALNSLLQQTWSDWECIIINDGSTDNTSDVVEHYRRKDARFKLISLSSNSGRPTARQKGLDGCRGSLVAMLDADDIYMPNKLESQVTFLDQHPSIGMVSTRMFYFDNNYRSSPPAAWQDQYTIYPRIARYTSRIVPHAPTMFQRTLLKDFQFDPNMRRAEDSYLILHLSRQSASAILNQELYGYRKHCNLSRQIMLEGFEGEKHLIEKSAGKINRHVLINRFKYLLVKYNFDLYLKLSPISCALQDNPDRSRLLQDMDKITT